MNAFVFTPGRGSDPEVLDVWSLDESGSLVIRGNVYQRGRYPGTGKWAARIHALGRPDATGLASREAAARWLHDHSLPAVNAATLCTAWIANEWGSAECTLTGPHELHEGPHDERPDQTISWYDDELGAHAPLFEVGS